MAQAKTAISRRTVFSSALAAGAALTVPVVALAATDVKDDNFELLQKQLATLGKALHDGRLDVQWYKSKTGKLEGSKFTIRLDGSEGAQFMGAILAGTIFAGLADADELIAKLTSSRVQS
jgi:hypothetical protein